MELNNNTDEIMTVEEITGEDVKNEEANDSVEAVTEENISSEIINEELTESEETDDGEEDADSGAESNSDINTIDEAEDEVRFSRDQIVKSKKYKKYADMLNTLLGDSKYGIDEVDSIIKEFLNKEVM